MKPDVKCPQCGRPWRAGCDQANSVVLFGNCLACCLVPGAPKCDPDAVACAVRVFKKRLHASGGDPFSGHPLRHQKQGKAVAALDHFSTNIKPDPFDERDVSVEWIRKQWAEHAPVIRFGLDLSAEAGGGSQLLVPVVPTEAQWNGLARDLIMWMDSTQRPTGKSLYQHLEWAGREIPDWLRAEIPENDHVPPKGTRAAVIYRAMVEDYAKQQTLEKQE